MQQKRVQYREAGAGRPAQDYSLRAGPVSNAPHRRRIAGGTRSATGRYSAQGTPTIDHLKLVLGMLDKPPHLLSNDRELPLGRQFLLRNLIPIKRGDSQTYSAL